MKRIVTRFDRTPSKTKRSQVMRRNMPPAEVILWSKMKGRQLSGFRFRRQHPVGSYFLDFYCPEIKLCIELDGDQHGQEQALIRDRDRTSFLEDKNITVLRFWNNEIYDNVDGVLEAILEQALSLGKEIKIRRDGISSP